MTEIGRSETFGYLLAGPSNKSAAIGIREPHPVTFEGSSRREAYSGIVYIVRHKGKITTWNSERGVWLCHSGWWRREGVRAYHRNRRSSSSTR
jgi:hypothetical protein